MLDPQDLNMNLCDPSTTTVATTTIATPDRQRTLCTPTWKYEFAFGPPPSKYEFMLDLKIEG